MDMGSSTSMAGMTSTAASAMSTSTGMAMGGMGGMGGGGAHACKISMLWNWNTIDACFLSRSWHITSAGMFAGSCIGVIFLTVSLEFLRRVGREYDKFITRNHIAPMRCNSNENCRSGDSSSSSDNGKNAAVATARSLATFVPPKSARPTVLQQIIRATIHMLQFAVAYFIMLLAMYYNGYIIICIFIGAWIGAFTFSWDQLAARSDSDANAVTGCCG